MSDNPNRSQGFRPQFTPSFSFGNIATIITGIVTFAMAWTNLNGRVETNHKTIERHTIQFDTTAARVRANEIAITRQDERTNTILNGIARIEGQLSAIDKRLDEKN